MARHDRRLMHRSVRDDPRRPVRVLQSFGRPVATTNPSIAMLHGCLDRHPEVELLTFTWPRALTEDLDVFRAHWPEVLVGGRNPMRTQSRRCS